MGTIFSDYELVKRIVSDLNSGKASLQIIGPAGDIQATDIFPEMEHRFVTDCEAYLIDLRRQIRQQLEVDDAEYQIENVTTGMFGKEKNDGLDQGQNTN